MFTRREMVLVAKLLFIILAIMFLIALKNAVTLPAEQFIYGRF